MMMKKERVRVEKIALIIHAFCVLMLANRQWIKKIHSISDLGSQVVINDSHERFITKAKEPIFQFSAGGCLACIKGLFC
jgi:hypothetical protein